MAFSSISDLWNKWNIRSFVLLSLSLQVFLILFSPIRKKTANDRIIFLLWLAYLMADWVAAFAIGLISHNQGNLCAHATEVDGALQAFWASFLLLHLGGPDTITAFSLEDSSLWRRHLLSLIFQISAAIYVFAQIFPSDRSLMIPTMLVFLVGVIKNAERTLALNLSSLPRLREWVLSQHESVWANEGLCMRMHCFMNDEEGEARKNESTVVEIAYYFFQISKIFLGDLMFTRAERTTSYKCFTRISAMDALRVISIELQFIYEVLHTKTLAIRSKLSYIFRFITFMGVLVAFVLFNRLKKHQLSKLDVKITYTLLFGGIILDVIALFMLIFSDWTLAEIMQKNSGSSRLYLLLYELAYKMNKLRKARSATYKVEPNANVTYKALDTPLIFRRWSESISACNLLSMSLKKSPRSMYKCDQSLGSIASSYLFNFPIHMVEKIISYFDQAGEALARGYGERTSKGKIVMIANTKYVSKNPFIKKLWIFIFTEVRRKSSIMDKLTKRSMYEPAELRRKLRDMDEPTERSMHEPTEVGHESKNTDENIEVRCESENMHEPTERSMHEPTEVGHESRNMDETIEVRCESENMDEFTEVRKIFEARGDLFLKSLSDEVNYDNFDDFIENVTKANYDDSIIMWHIATEIWYNKEKSAKYSNEREFSKILSDYMLYLLLNQPNVVSAVAGMAQLTAGETLKELQLHLHIRSSSEDVKGLCGQLFNEPLNLFVRGRLPISVLMQAITLAQRMERLGEIKWKMMSGVWVEMLSYAASHIKGTTHVQVLSKGGELLTIVWLLMAHFGCVYKPELGICYEPFWLSE